MDLRRERWSTPDGDFLDVDFTPDPDPSSPLVLVLHGLEGSSRRSYVLIALHALRRLGVAGVALNFRGCSGQPNLAPRAYHSGETGDPTLVIEELRHRFPSRPLGALGFSLGGNILLKLLGERGAGGDAVAAAVTISVPYDLAAGSLSLESTRWGRFYANYFLRSLKRKTRERAALLEGHADLSGALSSRTLRQFDDALTAPLHGFTDAEDYYGKSSSAAYLDGIDTPTLLIHALDDPFLPPDAVPWKSIEDNPSLTKAFSAGGGHVGFVNGTPWAARFWAEWTAAAFLAARLGDGQHRGR